ncbi:MAG: CopD family protein [Oceanococcus sp.]
MLWVKAFHIVFVVTWFAGLFYLPRLFVYHADCSDRIGNERFKVMERRLLGITHIGGALSLLFGTWLLLGWRMDLLSSGGWFHAKLLLVFGLLSYHYACIRLVHVFREDRNMRSHKFYRYFNEAPVLLLIAIVILAVVKPF